MHSLGERIRHHREKTAMKQKDLAKAAGISRVTLNRIENGEQAPRYENLVAIGKALGVSFTDLVNAD